MKLSLSVRVAEAPGSKEETIRSFDQIADLAAEIGYHAVCMRASQVGIQSPLREITDVRKKIRELNLAVTREWINRTCRRSRGRSRSASPCVPEKRIPPPRHRRNSHPKKTVGAGLRGYEFRHRWPRNSREDQRSSKQYRR